MLCFAVPLLRIPLPAGMGYRLLLTFILCANVAWWTLADHALTRMLSVGRGAVILRAAQAMVSLGAMGVIIAILLFGRGRPMTILPVWLIGSVQMWHMGLAVLMPIALALAAPVLAALVLRRRIASRKGARLADTVPSADAPHGDSPSGNAGNACARPLMSRRQWLTTALVYAPSAICTTATLTSMRGTQAFQVNEYDLPAPWLPRRLAGLTITQVSDLHLGRLYRPYMLPRLVEAVNRLDSDIVVVTGDIIDLSNDMIAPARHAFRQFGHRHGLYICVGNHDLLDDREMFLREWRDANFQLLVNQRRGLRIGGERLCIAGIDWSPRDIAASDVADHGHHVRDTLHGYDRAEEGPCITLAHHPHAFDALSTAGVPLTLSGHTRGGQLMWHAPRSDGVAEPSREAGIGQVMFRYIRGFYSRGPSTLFVNRGVGNWFPLRVNAAAEIVKIRLT